MKFLLDYVFPITVITPTPAASTAFLKQVCVVAKPKSGQEGNVDEIFECTTMTQVAARTDNTNAQQLFNAGMAKVYILLANDLDLTEPLSGGDGSDFYTLLISDDFTDSDIEDGVSSQAVKAEKKIQDILYRAKTAGVGGNSINISYADGASDGEAHVSVMGPAITVQIETGVTTAQTIADAIEESVSASALVDVTIDEGDEDDSQIETDGAQTLSGGLDSVPGTEGIQVGTWDGVIGVYSSDTEVLQDQAVIEKRVAFYGNETNKAKNMFYAFGKFLSAASWTNQQYITMPFDDDIDSLGEANSLFDDRISFALNDDEFGKSLGFFVVGGKAIVAPYILKNLRIDLQSRALQWISANQPSYTKVEASLLETRLQEDVINAKYVQINLITAGTVAITLVNDNFVASGAINVAEPKAFWKVIGEMRQTL